jgi:hypothetical protein
MADNKPLSEDKRLCCDFLGRAWDNGPNSDEALRLACVEIIRLRRTAAILPTLDCRYTGAGIAEMSGSHCPTESPCQRCKLERTIAELERDNAKLRAALKMAANILDLIHWERNRPEGTLQYALVAAQSALAKTKKEITDD